MTPIKGVTPNSKLMLKTEKHSVWKREAFRVEERSIPSGRRSLGWKDGKVLAAKFKALSLTPGTQIVEGKKLTPPQVFL